jgi:hypothetical protein
MFGADGQITAGPWVYQNGLGTVSSKFPFVFREVSAGNFSPRSATGSIQIEQPLSQHLTLRTGFTQKESAGLVILNPVAPGAANGWAGANLLSGGGQSRYHQFEVTARLRLNHKRQLFFSYVRSQARGDLNDFGSYLGSFPVPILRANQFGNCRPICQTGSWRGSGTASVGLSNRTLINIEAAFPTRNGRLTELCRTQYTEFPQFPVGGLRFSKDIQVNPKYAVRLSVSGYNLTNHFNPEAFHNNAADPAFGLFSDRGAALHGRFRCHFLRPCQGWARSQDWLCWYTAIIWAWTIVRSMSRRSSAWRTPIYTRSAQSSSCRTRTFRFLRTWWAVRRG